MMQFSDIIGYILIKNNTLICTIIGMFGIALYSSYKFVLHLLKCSICYPIQMD